MIEDWAAMIEAMSQGVRALTHATPAVMKTFGDMAKAAHGGSALDAKAKELVALAIAVAIRCGPCIAYHAQGSVKAGASRAEVAETLGMAAYMGAGPSVMYAAEALAHLIQRPPYRRRRRCSGRGSRIRLFHRVFRTVTGGRWMLSG